MSEDTNTKAAPFCRVEIVDGAVHFEFGNGETLSLAPADLSEEIQFNLMCHGLIQKIRDSFAGAKGDFAFAIGASNKVIDNLREGRFTASRGTGESTPRSNELVEAISRVKNLPTEQVAMVVENASNEQRKAWRANARIKAEIAAIRLEKAQRKAGKAESEELDFEL